MESAVTVFDQADACIRVSKPLMVLRNIFVALSVWNSRQQTVSAYHIVSGYIGINVALNEFCSQ